MLHILLLILKIIGIILAAILGIIILLLGIVLFVPIRYEISAKCDGTVETLKAKAKATWLLHLLRADVLVKGNKIKWQVRVAWIKKSSAMALGGRKEEKNHETKEDESEKESQKVEEAVIKNEDIEETSESCEEKCETHPEEIKENRLEEDQKIVCEKCEVSSETGETISEESEKKSVGSKIKEKYEKIKVSIDDLLNKKDKVCDLLTDESHIRAFKKLKKELFILLKRLKPKKVQIKMKFGFDDPSVTGKVLGGISMIYPFLGDTTEIIPDFENKILKGNVYIKGRIRISHFAALAVKLLLCKDIRTSYKDIKNFKL